jgi:hypothetical protein
MIGFIKKTAADHYCIHNLNKKEGEQDDDGGGEGGKQDKSTE